MADKSLESASTVPSSYHVFLSFRGEDTRNKFIAHLYNALVNAGIETYKDDQKLERGEEIEPSLLQAIQDSRISIPVFSENYASSTWCLRELTEIIKCRRERGQTVLPVFLSADPSDVRIRPGSSFEKAFLRHEERFGKETVDRWREAMTEAANLSGWNLKDAPANGNEAELVKLVVKAVWSKLNDDTHLDVAKHLVGIGSHVEYMTKLLNVEPSKVFFVGIRGMGGIGKTTIAKAVFNQIFSYFEGSCFLEDVRENSKQKGLVSLQNKLLTNILKGNQDIDIVSRGITMIKERMRTKKVLIVLDDVDDKKQLDSLAGGPDWFGSGSRIIITTRDKKVLNVHGVDKIYEPKEMDLTQSLQLFSKHAFGSDQPPEGYMDLSEKIVLTTGGLPLALEVLGSCLFGETEQSYWESILKKLKKIPRPEVQKKLQISFDELDYEEKEIFLDIACFFIGMDKEDVIYIWDGCDFSSTIGIKVLIKKSLVKIGDDNKLWMHDQLRDMGREIVREDGGRDLGKYSRLWDRADVFDVLKKQMGSTNVKGLVQPFERFEDSDFRPHLRTEAFAGMSQLRLLRVDYAPLDGDFEHFPPELRWLSWRGCPLEFIPTNFHMEKLVVLDLSWSNIRLVWNEWHQNQVVKTLKVLDLSYCADLIRTPNFTGFPCLERLSLQSCSSLEEVHRSIGNLKKLIYLNLEWCGSLVEVPSSISKLDSLENLVLSGCLTLKTLPDLDGMKSLRELFIDSAHIKQLPDSIGCLKNLRLLSLKTCLPLRILPDSLGKLESLRELRLDNSGVEELPDSIGCLKNLSLLSLEHCFSLRKLPNSLGKLESLRELNLGESRVEELPDSIGCLKNLRELRLDKSGVKELPDSIGCLKNLSLLSLKKCKSLRILPNSLGKLEFLMELNPDESIVEELPDSIGCLKNLGLISLKHCKSLRKLPDSLGKLESLRELFLKGTAIERLPDSIGCLKNLSVLSLKKCESLRILPNSLGNLESLRELRLDKSGVKELPDSIVSLKKLEILNLRDCRSLTILPNSIGDLESLSDLELCESAIYELPRSIGRLLKLPRLSLEDCKFLGKLPDTLFGIESLIELKLSGIDEIREIPEFHVSQSKLEKLTIWGCESFSRLPDSLGNLESLKEFILYEIPIDNIPDSIGSLKKLEKLSIKWCGSLTNLPDSISNVRNLTTLEVDGAFITELPNGIGSLEKLEELSAGNCKKLVKLPDSMGNLRLLKEIRMVETGIVELPKDFGMLQSLKVLDMSGCQEFKGLPEKFASLSQLDKLKLAYCTELEYLPELPSSLVELDVTNCLSLERLADLSNLEKLEVLTLSNCEKLLEIEGIERLKSLSELSMIGCNNINRNTLRKIFVQGAFERLETFSFPGSDIPDWFAHQEFPSVVCIPPYYEIDRLILCGFFSRGDGYQDTDQSVGVSTDFPSGIRTAGDTYLEDEYTYFPFGIRTSGDIYLEDDCTLKIRGIPKANEDQVCLFYCQPDDYYLRNWKNGDEIDVYTRTGLPGIYGKKAAVHVAYRPAVRGLESKAMVDNKQLSHINQKLADFYTCDAGGGSQHSVVASDFDTCDVAGSSHSLVVAPEPEEIKIPCWCWITRCFGGTTPTGRDYDDMEEQS